MASVFLYDKNHIKLRVPAGQYNNHIWEDTGVSLGTNKKGNEIVLVRQSGISGAIKDPMRKDYTSGSKFYLFQKDEAGKLIPLTSKEFAKSGKQVAEKLRNEVAFWNLEMKKNRHIERGSYSLRKPVINPINGYTLVFGDSVAQMTAQHKVFKASPLDADHKRLQQEHIERFSSPGHENELLTSRRIGVPVDIPVIATLPPITGNTPDDDTIILSDSFKKMIDIDKEPHKPASLVQLKQRRDTGRDR